LEKKFIHPVRFAVKLNGPNALTYREH